ncbi:hypothetical protein [Endozoicomonas lisbonensis]|uniref:Uncharacterized protein n=1 Tax=Endozoicomonas lisbonensis TaxID=3120522 RepID=A0ABV2SBR4_9GAMM
MKTVVTSSYLFLFLFWGLLFSYGLPGSDDEVVEYNVQVSNRFDVLTVEESAAEDESGQPAVEEPAAEDESGQPAVEEPAAEDESEQPDGQNAGTTEIWQVTTNTLSSEQVAEIYNNIQNLLASNPATFEFWSSFHELHPDIQNYSSWHCCMRLSTDSRRLYVFTAILGFNAASYELTGIVGAINNAWKALESRNMYNFGWYQVGTALLITGELRRNRHIDPALSRFYERYGHLSQQFEMSGDIDLETLWLHIERFNQAVIDSDRDRVGSLSFPAVMVECLSILFLLAYQSLFCQS